MFWMPAALPNSQWEATKRAAASWSAHRRRHLALVLDDKWLLLQVRELEGQPHRVEAQLLEAPHHLHMLIRHRQKFDLVAGGLRAGKAKAWAACTGLAPCKARRALTVAKSCTTLSEPSRSPSGEVNLQIRT